MKFARQLTCSILIYFSLTHINADGSKILAVFGNMGKSHFIAAEPYLEELASRGHNLLVISNFPRQKTIPNYRDIDLKEKVPMNKTVGVGVNTYDEMTKSKLQLHSSLKLTGLGNLGCEKVLNQPQVQELIKSNEEFDLLIADIFNTNCFLTFGYRFKIPIVGFSASIMMPWVPARVGNPDNPSYIPGHFSQFTNRMNFQERLVNTFWYIIHYITAPYFMDYPAIERARKVFGESLPELSVLARNTSLILVNTYFSLNGPRPLVPGVVEIAGLHVQKRNMLPEDLEDYLNGAEDGVIYFSMGSMIRAETLPPEKRDAFLQAFAELPQRVLWKWEGDTLPGQPKNVKIAKWLPQFDILNHPKVRVFLAHGGLLGTIEAVHVGVPMIGIPMYGDQSTNIKMIVDAGMGIKLNYADITKENVLKALKTVLNNPSYKENAMRTSRAFRDRPMSPMDTAIFWTEYVIRHRGAPHMRTAGADLPLYQYLLLDVIAVLLVGFLIILYVTYFIIKKILSLVCGSNKKDDSAKKRQ